MATAAAVSLLSTKAFNHLDNYGKSDGMEDVKNRLRLAMPKFQAVFNVANLESIRQQSSALDAWLWRLRDAVEEAEDSIDELEYYQLDAKPKDPKVSGRSSCFGKMKHRFVRSVIKRGNALDNTRKKFTHRHRDTLKRLAKALDGLAKAAEGVEDVFAAIDHLRGTGLEGQSVDDEDGKVFLSNATAFIGRENEKKQIIGWLTNTSDESSETMSNVTGIPIVSVVGHGGMGKTALAQSICEEEEVLKCFNVIWVTVSTTFDATSLTCKILECVTGQKPSVDRLDPLQQYLKEKLKSMNYLLVLDDVWEDKKLHEWERLFAPLRQLNTGSKILLTTRMQSVSNMAASVMGVRRDQCLTLQGLEEDKNLELFNHHVFSGLNSQAYMHFKLIGEQIAKKLGGCPLVTKVTSGHLRGNMTTEYWHRFLDESLESFKSAEHDIISVLRLSYYDLPTELQMCFRYCSLFPVDHEFRKEELVKMWIGSGLISQPTSYSHSLKLKVVDARQKFLEQLGDTANQFLAQLTRKSFFDRKSRARRGVVTNEYYLMNGIMHELARTMSLGECARITDPARFEDEKDTVRHLCIAQLHNFSVEHINKIFCFKKLRTIIIDSNCEAAEDIACALEKVLESSKSLRLIHSKLRNTLNFADKFVNLKHLRYLYLDRMSPDGMRDTSKLHHLTSFHSHSGLHTGIL
ncbi:putative disease resistance protein RGA4 [Hordeum vulgare subsp. vulgare]|uniref:NB-ARC domain-containing protein n=1 Tax=Hordeum vulgare subsp. vulgare TaxID=112509 RepID=A0A8I6YHB4_HORVV|nr:putative disease resistance protein RGA4 [Hordeum vulgare subsp. vulgare]